jgi:hypothetical protein
METSRKKLSLAELLTLVALVAAQLGLWRRYGGEWTQEENQLGICWLVAWTVSYLGGRGIVGRAALLCCVLSAVACGGFMAWLQKLWQVVVAIAFAAGLLAALAALILQGIQFLPRIRWTPKNRKLVSVAFLVLLAVTVATGVGTGIYRYTWPGPPKPQLIRLLSHLHGSGNSPLKCSTDARYLATGYHPNSGVVVVADLQWGVSRQLSQPEYIGLFLDLSPSGTLLLLADQERRKYVTNRLTGKTIGPLGESQGWGHFVDEEQILIENRDEVSELWDISADSPRRIPLNNSFKDASQARTEVKREWLSSFPIVNWYGNPARNWYFQSEGKPNKTLEFLGIGADKRTVLFCEWETCSSEPQTAPHWTENLPFVRPVQRQFVTVNLAAIDADNPGKIRRSSSVKMDYVLGRYDALSLNTVLSGDRKTAIVFDGHYNVALWRIEELQLMPRCQRR